MQSKLFVMSLCLGLLTACGSKGGSGSNSKSAACGSMGTTACSVFTGVNQERTSNGLPALTPNESCVQLAQSHADDMAQNKFFAHESPNKGSFSDRAQAFRLSMGGENIAMGYRKLDQLVQGWMNSPGHRKNILTPAFKSGGIGYAVDDKGVPYYAQCFSD